MPMDIRIQVDDMKHWAPGSRMSGLEHKHLLTAFSKKIAEIYVEELIDAINSQRYKGRWEPLSESYLKFKKENGLSTNIWEASSLLKESITYYRSDNSYVVGINRRLMYPGTKVPVFKVCRWMEFGTTRMPARPLFIPVKQKLERNMSRYWREFLIERGVI